MAGSPQKVSSTPWKPRRAQSQPPPDSPSISTHVSVGYESESRISSPDADPDQTGTYSLSLQHDSDAFCKSVENGIHSKELSLHLHNNSCGGTYIIKFTRTGVPVAVFKPADEEIGQDANPHGNTDSERVDHFFPGTGWKREVLAYALDHDHVAAVPLTVEACINGKHGSLQRFVPNCTESADHLPGRFSTDEVHRIALLDLRVLNGDRHGGNILVGSQSTLIPIDHSYIAPSGFADPEFEWLHWPQARLSFSDEVRSYVARLDPEKDRDLVAEMLDDEEAAETVYVATTVVKIGASRGYSALDLAKWFRRETLTQPSCLEHALAVCRRTLDTGGDLDMNLFREIASAAFPDKRF